MSKGYLCDECGCKLDGGFRNTCECLPHGGEHRKKAIEWGEDEPRDVCPAFEPKEDAR